METLAEAVIEPAPLRRSVMLAALAIGPVLLVAALGTLATIPNIDSWYSTLAKPNFTPPGWVFAPIWTALYCLMSYAFFRILRLSPGTPGRTAAIVAFIAQIALNGSWAFAFFAAHSPALGVFVIIPLEALVFTTIILFARLDRIAAVCLWPYAAWVAVAIVLNVSLWILNP